FNETRMDYPREKTIHALFEEQVEKTPDQIAVVCEGEKWTYRELNERANQVARVLRKQGVGPEQVVGLLVRPSLEMIVGVLAVLKAGGAYLPIDASYPSERIQFMLEDSGARWLLVSSSLAIPAGYQGTILLPEEIGKQEETGNLEHINQPQDLAYVIYTSGSTGKPKGVMVEHRSVVNLSFWHNQFYEVTPADRSTKLAGFGFDASVWEIFPYLLAGATLYIIPEHMRSDVLQLHSFYEENGITISFLPTQLAEQFMEWENRSLRVLLIGGDRAQKVRDTGYRIVNNYGPSENTVVTTSGVITPEDAVISIGKPIANNQIYILNHDHQLQPIGVPGELCISG
ncbi:AMP-binding protein, partial [Thermoflavimicrobium dichotomicum]